MFAIPTEFTSLPGKPLAWGCDPQFDWDEVVGLYGDHIASGNPSTVFRVEAAPGQSGMMIDVTAEADAALRLWRETVAAE